MAEKKQITGATKSVWANPRWFVGDGTNLNGVPSQTIPEKVDLIFTCPPYFNLEKYSDDPRDLSNMEFKEFKEGLALFAETAYKRLNENRFAVIVMGDVRNKHGYGRALTYHVTEAMLGAGFGVYNEGILITAVGSLPIRVGKQFSASRKLGRSHQNVMVFFKGNPAKIKLAFPSEIECGELSEYLENEPLKVKGEGENEGGEAAE